MFGQLLDEPDGLRAPTPADLACQNHEPAAHRVEEFRIFVRFRLLSRLDGYSVFFRSSRSRLPCSGERGDQGLH